VNDVVKRKYGDIFKIELGDGSHSYAVSLDNPLFGIFGIKTFEEMNIKDIEDNDIIFKVWVMDYATKDDCWKKIGHTDGFQGKFDNIRFFKQDLKSGKITSYNDRDGTEIPITYEDAVAMEAAAVWDPHHVEDRILDYFAGIQNKWVDRLRPKLI
jgi:hypothetical protein